ncbi:MAG TPA: dihydropteroate synthase [Candidatus Saccharimonadales bacterium]|nr:dihydropteroate synthase [Candidatus Saccharimonadales bacterium]
MSLYAELGNVKIGDEHPVRIMGVINVSPESFYKGSVKTDIEKIRRQAEVMVEQGADIIDVGAMSTAPYLSTNVSIEEEIHRLTPAIQTIADTVHLPISVDTTRAPVADAALSMGAIIVNDVTGLKNDQQLANVISKHNASAILMAHETEESERDPIARIKNALTSSLDLSRSADISDEKIVLDPGLGFFRQEGKGIGFSPTKKFPWYTWDCTVIRELGGLRDLQRPLCISASRKSFIGKILDLKKPEERLIGSIAAAAIATFNGAHLIRTHDVAESVQAVRMAENIRRLGV